MNPISSPPPPPPADNDAKEVAFDLAGVGGASASERSSNTIVVILVVLGAWLALVMLTGDWCGIVLVVIAVGVVAMFARRRSSNLVTRVEVAGEGVRFLRATGHPPVEQLDWSSVHCIAMPSLAAGGLVELRVESGFLSREWIVLQQPARVAHRIASALHGALARVTRADGAGDGDDDPIPDHDDLQGPPCLACGYDRTGIDVTVPCPECGAPPVRAALTFRVSNSTLPWTDSTSIATVHDDGLAISAPGGHVRNIEWPSIIALQVAAEPDAESVRVDIKAVVSTMTAKTRLSLPVASGHRLAAAIHNRLAAWHARQPAPA